MTELAEGIFLQEQTGVVSMQVDVFQALVAKIPDKDCCLYRVTHCGDSTRWQEITLHILAKDPNDAYAIFSKHFGGNIGKEDTINIAYENCADNILR